MGVFRPGGTPISGSPDWTYDGSIAFNDNKDLLNQWVGGSTTYNIQIGENSVINAGDTWLDLWWNVVWDGTKYVRKIAGYSAGVDMYANWASLLVYNTNTAGSEISYANDSAGFTASWSTLSMRVESQQVFVANPNGFVFGSPAGGATGAGTINAEGLYVNGVAVGGGGGGGAGTIYDSGDISTASLAQNGIHAQTITHGLGTDNVKVDIIGHGASSDAYVASWLRPDGHSGSVQGMDSATFSFQSVSGPVLTGTVDIAIKQRYTAAQVITFRVIVTALD